MLILEFGAPVQLKPGIFRSKFKGQTFIRAWWLYFAIAWTPLCLKDYSDHIRHAETEWRDV
jgi:hypothetical protein